MTYDDVAAEAEKLCLTSLGGFHPMAQDQAPEGCQTLILLGPKEPAFWPYFQRSDEFLDGRPDPLDRWSTRILGSLAETLEATAPFTIWRSALFAFLFLGIENKSHLYVPDQAFGA